MKTITFLGTKEIGAQCLEWLIIQAPSLNFQISNVLTNDRSLSPNQASTVRSLAEREGLTLIDSLSDLLETESTDYIVSVQYHKILKLAHIKKATEIAVNYHMAPLPEYRGCNQFSFAIANGDLEFGTTVHQLDEGIDSGPILFERRFPIPAGCFVKELYELTFAETLALFKESVPKLLQGSYSPRAQSSYGTTRRTQIYYRKDIDILKSIDLSSSKDQIERQIRATAMPGFYPPYCDIEGHRFYISNNPRI